MADLIGILDRITGSITVDHIPTDFEPLPLCDSPYVGDQSLLDMLRKSPNQYATLSFNCCSLKKKFSEIAVYVEWLRSNNCNNIGVICIQECWLASDADLSPFELDGYQKPFFVGSSASERGGLITFVHESLKAIKLPSPHKYKVWEVLLTEVLDPLGNKLLVSNVYQPPRDAVTTSAFLEDFEFFYNIYIEENVHRQSVVTLILIC